MKKLKKLTSQGLHILQERKQKKKEAKNGDVGGLTPWSSGRPLWKSAKMRRGSVLDNLQLNKYKYK